MTRIYCTLERISFKAYFISTMDKKGKKVSLWLPKSQVTQTDCLAVGDEGYMDIPEWLAVKNNLNDKDITEEDDLLC